MLRITVPATELWDETANSFIPVEEQTLQLEHSLVSLSKWESKWHKPFFSKEEKTNEETLDYIKCMTITQNVKPIVYQCLTQDNVLAINSYIEDPMTATTFYNSQDKRKINGEQITAELIYYWMIASSIPFECQKWHLNRLITLIRVCSVKSQPPKKMDKRTLANDYAKMNAARRAKYNSKG